MPEADGGVCNLEARFVSHASVSSKTTAVDAYGLVALADGEPGRDRGDAGVVGADGSSTAAQGTWAGTEAADRERCQMKDPSLADTCHQWSSGAGAGIDAAAADIGDP